MWYVSALRKGTPSQKRVEVGKLVGRKPPNLLQARVEWLGAELENEIDRVRSQDEDVTVEQAIAGLSHPDKTRRLGMFQLLHEYVSGDTRKALQVGGNLAAWDYIRQVSLFSPSWSGLDQPGRKGFMLAFDYLN